MPERAGDAEDVDAPVGIEVLVFDGDDGLAKDRGEVVVVDDDALLEREGADDAALGVVEVGHGGGPVALEVVDLGQIDREDQHEAGQRAGDDGQQAGERRMRLCRRPCGGERGGGGTASGRSRWVRPRPRESTECAGGAANRSLVGNPLASAACAQSQTGMPYLKASTLADWLSAWTEIREPRRARVKIRVPELAVFGLEKRERLVQRLVALVGCGLSSASTSSSAFWPTRTVGATASS